MHNLVDLPWHLDIPDLVTVHDEPRSAHPQRLRSGGREFRGGFFGSPFAVDMVIGCQTRELQAGLIRHYPT